MWCSEHNALINAARVVTASILLAGTVAPRVARAQPQGNPETRVIMFEHDGTDTTGYALYVARRGGKEQRIDVGFVAHDEAGTVRVSLPKLPPGIYAIMVAAYNNTGESPKIPAVPPVITVGGAAGQRRETPTVPAGSVAPPASAPLSDPPPPDTGRQTGKRSGFLGWLFRLFFGTDGA